MFPLIFEFYIAITLRSAIHLSLISCLLVYFLHMTCDFDNAAAVQEQRNAFAAAMDSAVGESSAPDRVLLRDRIEENFEPLCLGIQQVPVEPENCTSSGLVNAPLLMMPSEFHIEDGFEGAPNVEHQFISSFAGRSSPVPQNNQEENLELKELLASGSEEISVSLQLGEPEAKRRKGSGC